MDQSSQQRQSQTLTLFLLFSLLLFGYLTFIRPTFYPPTKPPEGEAEEKKKKDLAEFVLPATAKPTPDEKLITIGEENEKSPFNLGVVLDPRGGGVRSVTLNKFNPADEDGRPQSGPMVLLPGKPHEVESAFALYPYAPDAGNTARPLDSLALRDWEIVKTAEGKTITEEEIDGKSKHSVSFRTQLNGVIFTKTYSLLQGDYHIGLRIDMEGAQTNTVGQKRPLRMRYQLAGGKGLPIEGKWYTGIFRNAVVAAEDNRGQVVRDQQEGGRLTNWAGGNEVIAPQGGFIRYAGMAVQYFSSVIVVDDDQEDQRFLQRARPTLEQAVLRGRLRIPGGAVDRIEIGADGKEPKTIFVPEHLRAGLLDLKPGTNIAVLYRHLSYDSALGECPKLAVEIRYGDDALNTQPLWEDDYTVRVMTDTFDVEEGKTVSHKYLLYHGPIKPRLLNYLRGDEVVDPKLVDRYSTTLKLNTLTDYPSAGPVSAFSSFIGFTWLVIQCTNLMHWVLSMIQYVVPSYGLSIILLTILVRLLVLPLSFKQTMMSVKMQELQPELKALSDKYKDDKAAFAQAQMALFREKNVNPFGACWIGLLQMPIMLGLYFALQESILFRLAGFWPTWMVNLAAPDMMFGWGRGIPAISRDMDYGSMFYLGPFFNFLPLITVALMVIQQQMMSPPAMNPEQEMQQKIMKYMMIMFAFLFYKLAAGLCIYIITSTLWGLAERQFMPKAKKKDESPGDAANLALNGAGASSSALTATAISNGSSTNITNSGKKPKNKRKDRNKGASLNSSTDVTKTQPQTRWQRLVAWWNDVLEKAQKK
jgi:YidC/Oxa1 family membrane protein insertase